MSYIGTTKISKMYLGGTKIGKAYLGTDLVYNDAHVPVQTTVTLHPVSYDSDHAYYSIANPANAYNYADNTTYCRVRLTRGSAGAITYVYFKFDTSSIPAGATIDSVSCSAGIFINNTSSSNVAVRQCQMFTGTIAKGSSINATTTPRVAALSVGTWTREELNDARIRLYAERGTNNVSSDYYFYFYGATLTITYTY